MTRSFSVMDDIHDFVDEGARWVDSPQMDLLGEWSSYISSDLTIRVEASRGELARITNTFPSSAPIVRDTLVDTFIVRSPDSAFGEDTLLRVFAVMVGDESYAWLSKPPVDKWDKHPLFRSGSQSLKQVYSERFDGLCDMFMTGGLLPLTSVHPVTSEESGLEDSDWIAALSERTLAREVYEFANNGGGIHALVDLSRDGPRVPRAIWADDEDGIESMDVPLFSFVDGMMKASLEPDE